eukprot:comp19194_c0_seq1/m.21914 comp19194_c0_seq1/g.21914  ORF comp19194_c0_seq1/g.21914 comp19194_c0_seq1/m.21914 type:complete len:389 (-) comp19194_c0_seq1:405-1571(-)
MCLQVQPPADFIRVARRPKTPPPVLIVRREEPRREEPNQTNTQSPTVNPTVLAPVTQNTADAQTETTNVSTPVQIVVEPAAKSEDVADEKEVEHEEEDCSTKDKKKTVRRPMNSFMVFARFHRAAIQKAHPHKDNKAISKILGDTWGAMGAVERQRYVDMATELAQQHKKDHPDYKFRRVLRKKQKTPARSAPTQQYVSLQPSTRQEVPSVRFAPYGAILPAQNISAPAPATYGASLVSVSSTEGSSSGSEHEMRPPLALVYPASMPAMTNPSTINSLGNRWGHGSVTPPSSVGSPTEPATSRAYFWGYHNFEPPLAHNARNFPSTGSATTLETSSSVSVPVQWYQLSPEYMGNVSHEAPQPLRYHSEPTQQPARKSSCLWSVESMLS